MMNASIPATDDMAPGRPYEPPTLYAWDVYGVDAGSGGVTGDRSIAIGHVYRAIRSGESGARGRVRKVALSLDGSVTYVELCTVGEAWLDEMSGAVVWVGRWAR